MTQKKLKIKSHECTCLKTAVPPYFSVSGAQIKNEYELQQECLVCSGNKQKHNVSSLPSVRVTE